MERGNNVGLVAANLGPYFIRDEASTRTHCSGLLGKSAGCALVNAPYLWAILFSLLIALVHHCVF